MGSEISFLVTILQQSFYGPNLIKVAIKLNKTKESDWIDKPNSPTSKEILRERLPLHAQSIGPIVEVEHLFEVSIYKKEKA